MFEKDYKIFFAKVVDESVFASIYTKMCLARSTKDVPSSSNPAETVNFCKLVLSLCQKEFEMDSAGSVEAEKKRIELKPLKQNT